MSIIYRLFSVVKNFIFGNDNQPQVINKRKPIPKKLRQDVWSKYNGNKVTGTCYCCGVLVQNLNKGWHCSHVISDVKGGVLRIENLRVCCRTCNLSMGNQNLYAYIREKELKGQGSNNVKTYFKKHPSQMGDKRTNNWGKK